MRKSLLHLLCCLLCYLLLWENVQTAVRRCSSKQVFLKRKQPVLKPLFNKVLGPKACIFIWKETLKQVFSCEYCKKILVQLFYRRPVYYTFPKFYLMIDNWYFRVIFNYCKIRPPNRKNFVIDQSKFLVKGWFFLK